MKRFIYFLCALLVSLNALSQDKIQGIGKFKIGASESEIINALKQELGTEVEAINDVRSLIGNKVMLGVYVKDSTNSTQFVSQPIFCPGIKIYELARYTIAGLEFSKLNLIFLDKELVSMNANVELDVKDALTTKYGEPKVDYKEHPDKCTFSGTGIEMPVKRTTLFSTWENGPINCTFTMSSYYGRNCEKKWLNLVSVEHLPVMKKVVRADMDARKMVKEQEVSSKKRGLKDF